ncbi:hypothetical protein G6F60_007498 [Rhizopus arrhizus]|uniref:Uncharacterized protein n=1 Tax=Rhizopus oryzae TaxID=64495 RepID=A0A9P6XFW1_RHIOR|nr:hypothetical protein G6F24_005908 [Rhizopus arrhizus]KAG0908820.1 hypothetical protein G6F33_009349 [Rhizopus arrhizus]KAG0955797.1 hypothetical protein G6F32_002527 [Rhizopus arrhizus]KAG0968756.1 hypothetical protein G6F31_002531 [Rhizopus arrhizus]KAG1312921.1 hypothetical protein G6F64_002647 [Rhizopus arrhizus]
MGLFSWFQKDNSQPTKGLDEIPQKTTCYHIEGFLSCAYFSTAVEVGDRLTAKYPNVKVDVSVYIREQWSERARELQNEFKTSQRTSPFIYEGCDSNQMELIGGYTDFAKKIKSVYKMNVPLD